MLAFNAFLECQKVIQPEAEKLKASKGQDGYLIWRGRRLCDGERLLSGGGCV